MITNDLQEVHARTLTSVCKKRINPSLRRTVASFLHGDFDFCFSVWISGLGCVAAAGFIEGCAKGADSDEALHTRNLERQWATSSSTEYKDGGHKPGSCNNLARFSDNHVIQNLKLG